MSQLENTSNHPILQLEGKYYQTVLDTIDYWKTNQLLDDQTAKSLQQSIQKSGIDYPKITRYAFFASLFCVIIAIIAFFTDAWILELVDMIFNSVALNKLIALLIVSCLIFYYGQRFKAQHPLRVYSVEAIRTIGVISIVGCIILGCEVFNLRIDVHNVKYIFLIGTIIYFSLGLTFSSHVTCLAGLISFSLCASFSLYEIYEDNKITNSLIGLFLTISSIAIKHLFKQTPTSTLLNNTTKLFGLLYYFSFTLVWSAPQRGGEFNREIIIWKAVLFVSSSVSVWYGIKQKDGVFRGFGLVFFLLNLLLTCFDWFYTRLHNAIFFTGLAVLFWIFGAKAESWNLVNRLKQE